MFLAKELAEPGKSRGPEPASLVNQPKIAAIFARFGGS